jgi:hypothetical protein
LGAIVGQLEAAELAEVALGSPLLRATHLAHSLKFVARTAHSTVPLARRYWRRGSGTVSNLLRQLEERFKHSK